MYVSSPVHRTLLEGRKKRRKRMAQRDELGLGVAQEGNLPYTLLCSWIIGPHWCIPWSTRNYI